MERPCPPPTLPPPKLSTALISHDGIEVTTAPPGSWLSEFICPGVKVDEDEDAGRGGNVGFTVDADCLFLLPRGMDGAESIEYEKIGGLSYREFPPICGETWKSDLPIVLL